MSDDVPTRALVDDRETEDAAEVAFAARNLRGGERSGGRGARRGAVAWEEQSAPLVMVPAVAAGLSLEAAS